MPYTLIYLSAGKKRETKLNDIQAFDFGKAMDEARAEDHLQIGQDRIRKKDVLVMEKEQEGVVKRGDLRTELIRAANGCLFCGRRGFVLKADGKMHPCRCQISVKQAVGKDGYDYGLYGDENVKTDAKLLEPEKQSVDYADTPERLRNGWVKCVKAAFESNPRLIERMGQGDPFAKGLGRIIESYAIAPEEVGLPTGTW